MWASVEQIQNFLDEISPCCKKVDGDGEKFNLFQVLGIEYREIHFCRLLGALLNPAGSHGLGEKPLQLFLHRLGCGKEFSGEELRYAAVHLEEGIQNQRRVDLAIHIGNFVLPVEVKIWAGDQSRQLYDYYRYYAKTASLDRIYYLTVNGRQPSKVSRGELTRDQIVCLPFSKSILPWLDDVIKLAGNQLRVRSVAEQWREVLVKMKQEQERMNGILSVLHLGEGQEFELNEQVAAASALLSVKDPLWKAIRKGYLGKALRLDSNRFRLTDPIEIPEGEKEDRCIFSICEVDSGKVKAWICVDWNLYIVVKKVKEGCAWKGAEGYYWRYLSPLGYDKKFSLREPNLELNPQDAIVLDDLLEQVI